jgi:hypothetical protein
VVLHCGQTASGLGFKRSCDRRFPVREFECLRFGTAMMIAIDFRRELKNGSQNPVI